MFYISHITCFFFSRRNLRNSPIVTLKVLCVGEGKVGLRIWNVVSQQVVGTVNSYFLTAMTLSFIYKKKCICSNSAHPKIQIWVIRNVKYFVSNYWYIFSPLLSITSCNLIHTVSPSTSESELISQGNENDRLQESPPRQRRSRLKHLSNLDLVPGHCAMVALCSSAHNTPEYKTVV